MKRVLFFAVPFAMALVLSAPVSADEKAAASGLTVKVEIKDGKAVAKAGEHEYVLTGDKAPKEAGEYKVKGAVSADGKSFEVKEVHKAEAHK